MKNKRFFIALISAALALIMAFPAFADVIVSPIEIIEDQLSGVGTIIIAVLVAALVIAAAVIAVIIIVVRNDRKNAANRTAVKKDDDGSGENKT
ncbi:MAG: hypothetical protein PUE85_03200 [Firmicutes bacterium]|nr:hypothetical protein [Bacillota bacterium]